MNVFVLCTGRCGSVTFVESARHMTNYTAGHETRTHLTGDERVAYPADHLEADNRLSWFLGRLDAAYGDDAFYVHLTRDREATAQSFLKRSDRGIMLAYRTQILMGAARRNQETELIEFCRDYCDTINENIRLFLRDKSRTMDMQMENARAQLPDLWSRINAEGDLDAAQAEWDVRHNASATS